MKLCSRSDARKKELQFYYTGLLCTHGHDSVRYTNSAGCRRCNILRGRKNYKANKEGYLLAGKLYRENNKSKVRIRTQKYYQEHKLLWKKQDSALRANPSKYLWKSAKNRAKKKHVLFEISVEDVTKVLPKNCRCPILGIPIKIQHGKCSPNSMSLDRINPKLGYVIGNIAVISHLANTLKSNQTDPAIFFKIGKWLEKQNNKIGS